MSDAINSPLPESNQEPNPSGDTRPCQRKSAPLSGAFSRPTDTPSHSNLTGPWDFALCGIRAGEPSSMPGHARHPVTSSPIAGAASEAARALVSGLSKDRRRRRRALISAPVRVRGVDVTKGGPDEISTTVDVSRVGLLFATSHPAFYSGMEVAVTFPYSKSPTAIPAEQQGRVARIDVLADGRRAVAIALGIGVGEDLVDSCGRKLAGARSHAPYVRDPESKKPLVLAVDEDDVVRESLQSYLTVNGYDVIAVKTGAEAREVLKQFTPALLIAEVEGEDLPGFDLCAHVKSSPRLRQIPVLLTTRSGSPTDYSNAHSLGAVVCMAKPYKQDRLGHVARLLAPPPLCADATPKPYGRIGGVRGLCSPNRPGPIGGNSNGPDDPVVPRRFRFSPFR